MAHTWTNGETPDGIGETPVLVNVNNVPRYWRDANGRTFPLIAGAEDPPDDEHNEDDADAEAFDKDRALETIRKQRARERARDAEFKATQRELAALKAREQERADADKSELEKTQARLAEREKAHAEAEAKLRRMQITTTIERAARKFNARNPEVVAKLIDGAALEFDASGEPTNAEKLVKDLLAAEKYLVADGRTESSTGVPSTPRSTNQPRGHDDLVREKRNALIATGDYQPL